MYDWRKVYSWLGHTHCRIASTERYRGEWFRFMHRYPEMFREVD